MSGFTLGLAAVLMGIGWGLFAFVILRGRP